MINILHKTLQIDIAYSVNSFIYVLRRLPIFKDLITDDIYKSKTIKRIIGFFGMILRLLIFCVKACIALPILGGTLKVYKFLVEDGNAELYYKKISDLIKSTICKGTECASSNFSSQSSRLRNNIEGPSTPQ